MAHYWVVFGRVARHVIRETKVPLDVADGASSIITGMKRWQRSFFMNPFFDDGSEDEVDALQSQVKKLEAEVKALQTTKK